MARSDSGHSRVRLALRRVVGRGGGRRHLYEHFVVLPLLLGLIALSAVPSDLSYAEGSWKVIGHRGGAGTGPPPPPDAECTITSNRKRIVGTPGNDVICVGNGRFHTIFAGAGDDIVRGGKGNDVIHGGTGDDRLSGGSGGRDRLRGGRGKDICTKSKRGHSDCETIYEEGALAPGVELERVDDTALAGQTDPQTGDGELLLPLDTPVEVGEVVNAGPTEALPKGFLGRVISVTKTADGQLVKTEAVALPDIIPYGEVDLSFEGETTIVDDGGPSDDPGSTDDPGADDPGTDDPGADDPGADDPGADDSAGTSSDTTSSTDRPAVDAGTAPGSGPAIDPEAGGVGSTTSDSGSTNGDVPPNDGSAAGEAPLDGSELEAKNNDLGEGDRKEKRSAKKDSREENSTEAQQDDQEGTFEVQAASPARALGTGRALRCRGGSSASASVRPRISHNAQAGAAWIPFADPAAYFNGRVVAQATARLEVSAGASCNSGYHIDGPVLGTQVIQVGPVTVVFTLESGVDVRLNASTQAALVVEGQVSGGVEMRTSLVHGEFSKFLGPIRSASLTSDIRHEARARLDATASISLEAYGAAGPAVRFGPYVEAAARPLEDPSLEIDGGVRAGVDFVFDIWRIHEKYIVAEADLVRFNITRTRGTFPGRSHNASDGTSRIER